MFALSTVFQQRGTFQVPDISLQNPMSLLQLVTRPVWLVSLVVMALGWVFQAAALDRGRVAIVQTFLTMTLVFVLPLGWWLTAQKVTRKEIVAAAVVVVGLAAFAVVGNPANGVSDAAPSDWLIATVAVTCGSAAVLWAGDRRGPSLKAAANGAVSGASSGLTAVMAKPLLTDLHHGGLGSVFADPKLYIFVIYGALGVIFQQFGLATGRLAPTVAAGSVVCPIVSVILGAAILQETLERPPWHVFVATAGLALAFAAATVIAFAQARTAEPAAQRPA